MRAAALFAASAAAETVTVITSFPKELTAAYKKAYAARQPGDKLDPFVFEMKIPGLLALLANRDINSFVPGINDLVYGNEQEGIVSVATMMEKGKAAIADLTAYKTAKKAGDDQAQTEKHRTEGPYHFPTPMACSMTISASTG